MKIAFQNEAGLVILSANMDALFEYVKNKRNLNQQPPCVSSDEIVEFLALSVPAGVPFIKMKASDAIFENRSFRDAWEVDLTCPDGYGVKI
jgi:hypothetical protein